MDSFWIMYFLLEDSSLKMKEMWFIFWQVAFPTCGGHLNPSLMLQRGDLNAIP